MSSLNWQNFSSTQDKGQPKPATVASAATIVVTHQFTRITGTTPITKITPPIDDAYQEITLIFTTATAGILATGGSGAGAIHAAYTSIADRPVKLFYDPRTQLWYVQTVA